MIHIHLKSLYSEKYLKEKDKYSYYLDGNHGLVQIENLDISIIRGNISEIKFLTNITCTKFHTII